jgi:hypothetical protein
MSPLPLSPESYPPLTIPMAVPLQNSVNNVTMADVIGQKTDTELGNSIYSLLYRLDVDNHFPMSVWPTLAVGSPVVSAHAVWTYGAMTEIMPAGTVVFPFRIRFVHIEAIDKDGVFQLEMCYGGADTVFHTVRYAQSGGFFGNMHLSLLSSSLIPANSRIRMRLASSDGLANQCTQRISVAYR